MGIMSRRCKLWASMVSKRGTTCLHLLFNASNLGRVQTVNYDDRYEFFMLLQWRASRRLPARTVSCRTRCAPSVQGVPRLSSFRLSFRWD